jgi:Mg2+ and Co2+ transporter CorA
MNNKIYQANMEHCNNISIMAKGLKYEMIRISKLWEKTETMRFTLFSKKEIIKMINDSCNEFDSDIKNEFERFFKIIDGIKEESGE